MVLEHYRRKLRGLQIQSLVCVLLASCSYQQTSHDETQSETGLVGIKIRPYASDGCSAFPDGTLKNKSLWLACCQLHDFAYWKGGISSQRSQSDSALKQCVAKTGQPEIAALMLLGVRVGGHPFWPTPFRWGYGWPYGRGYKALTEQELRAVQLLTPENLITE